jgi:hypothetical protein
MTALTQDRNTPKKDGKLVAVAVGAGVHIRAGSIVVANATGFAVPGIAATTLTYLGNADQAVDNTAGGDGAQTVLVERGYDFKFANLGADPVTQASIGKVAYIVDDQTVAATNGGNTRSAAGKVVGIDSDGVWIS